MQTMKAVALVGLLLVGDAALGSTRADISAYQKIVDLRAEGDDFIVLHRHDWSGTTAAKRNEMMRTHQDPFRDDNDYAYVAWYSRHDGRRLRQLPSPALTWLGVSPDSRYVIGLSKVMLDNPYQLVVYSRTGELLLKRHIAAEVACLTPGRYRELRRSYSNEFQSLLGRVWTSGGVVYVDYLTTDMPRRLGRLWDALYPSTCPSPWSPNFSQSVTNSVYWYSEDDPAPEVVETEGKPTGVRLKDTKGYSVVIPFRLEEPRL